MPKGKIFISYRRDSGAAAARLVREALCRRRLRVFMDVEDLRSGHYSEILASQVRACSDFILVLTRGSLERCLQEGDWVTREVAEALKFRKNIVPVSFEEVQWPEYLPPEMAELRNFQVCKLSNEYFAASTARLIECLHTRPPAARPFVIAAGIVALFAALVALAFATGIFRGHRGKPPGEPNPTNRPPGPSTPQVFTQPVILHGPAGRTDEVELREAELQLWMGKRLLGSEPVETNGHALFGFSLATYRGQTVSARLIAEKDQWDLKGHTVALRLTGDTNWLELEHKDFTLRGSVKDAANDQPLQGAWVSVERIGTNTDSTGLFRLPMPGARWRPELQLLATNAGYIPTNLSIQDPFPQVQVRLREPDFSQTFRFVGPNGTNEASALSGGLLKLRADSVVLGALIGPQGEAQFDALPPSLRGVQAVITLELERWQLKGGVASVTLSQTTTPLEVEPTGIIVSGRVTASDKDQALKGAWVCVEGLSTNTDVSGAFRLFIPMVRVRAQLQVVVTNADWQSTTNHYPTGQTGTLAIRLQKPEPFTAVLRLTGPGGTPPPAALGGALLKLQSGALAGEATVGEQGQARFPALPRAVLGQTALLSLVAEDWQLKGGQVSIRLAETPNPLEVERTRATFRGQVRSEPDNQPLPNVWVSIGGVATNTDQSGKFVLLVPVEALQPPIELVATNAGYEPWRETVQVDAGVLAVGLKRQPLAPPVVGPPPPPQPAKSEAQLTNAVALARQQNQQAQLALSLNELGLLYDGRGQLPQACRAYDEAVELFGKLARSEPEPHRSNLATCLCNRGQAHEKRGEWQAALNDYDDARSLLEGLRRSGTDTVARIAGTQELLGRVQCAQQNQRQGLPNLKQAAATYRKLAQEDPARFRSPLIRALEQYANALDLFDDRALAGQAFGEAVANYQALGADQPDSPAHNDFATTLNRYAICLDHGPDRNKARDLYLRAAALYRSAPISRDPQTLKNLATTLRNLGIHYSETGELQSARKAYDEAIAVFLDLRKNKGWTNQTDYAGALRGYAVFLNNEIVKRRNEEDVKTAKADFNEALRIYRDAPLYPDRDADLADTLHDWGTLLYNVDDTKGAREKYSDSLELAKRLWQKKKENLDYDYGVKVCHFHLDLAKVCLDLADEGHASYRKQARVEIDEAERVRNELRSSPKTNLLDLKRRIDQLNSKLENKSQ
ncbi:MAG: TIR domain-containing protein [Verrucomicrobiota bacterium]|jgi:tetratricopeptide (TPR) repeat protein